MEFNTSSLTELRAFLSIYFFELESYLNSSYEELKTIKFQSEEANTDEYVKKHFRALLLEYNSIKSTNFQKVILAAKNEGHEIEVANLYKFTITAVYIPEELTVEQKAIIARSKKSVYTNPDLLLKIEDGEHTYFESLEIKSTKTNNIPGSSIQQVNPFEWVVFIKRSLNSIEVSTGYYINSITEKLPFPDRSPRPQVGFNTLIEWNAKNRIVQNGILTLIDNPEINLTKLKLLQDWQDYLATEWMAIIKNEDVKNSERWFNNTLRKFAIKFLEYSGEMDAKDREQLINRLRTLVKGNN